MMVNLEKTLPFGEPLEEEAEVIQNYCVKVGFGDLNSEERL
jgi:hypothetical protein